MPKFLSTILEFAEIIIIAGAFGWLVNSFILKPFLVNGSSMEPNFQTNEYVLIDEISYHITQPKRGQVIVFHYPKDTAVYFIKRIIGLPGETITIANNKVYVSDPITGKATQLDESAYLPESNRTIGNFITTLGPNEYFVLGDNRNASSDSRTWGAVPKNDIVGRVFLSFPFSSAFFSHTNLQVN